MSRVGLTFARIIAVVEDQVLLELMEQKLQPTARHHQNRGERCGNRV